MKRTCSKSTRWTKTKLFSSIFRIPPQHTCRALWAINHDSIATRNYIPPRLDVFLKNAVLHSIIQAKVNDEMGIWKVHLTMPRMKMIQSVKVQRQSTMEWKVISTGLYWCQPHHIRKRLSLNENHLTERKANKFAKVCKIWGASEIMKADGMSS